MLLRRSLAMFGVPEMEAAAKASLDTVKIDKLVLMLTGFRLSCLDLLSDGAGERLGCPFVLMSTPRNHSLRLKI